MLVPQYVDDDDNDNNNNNNNNNKVLSCKILSAYQSYHDFGSVGGGTRQHSSRVMDGVPQENIWDCIL